MEQPLLDYDRRLAVSAVPTGVTEVRRWALGIARDLGADERTLRRLALAVSEAATNAVLHAYPGQAGAIVTSIAREGDEIEVVVTDEGHGLQPRSDSPGLGMGLGIIADASDRLEIDARTGRGTAVRMWFTLGG
jgi:serine/threonine-protein kinase RsbW/stage II sporulation protein AB (anti-sigma F factor)